ncbi:MAG: hypothetical protein GY711_01325 [bacterium]|nr:hypothetical protein [bacterium]
MRFPCLTLIVVAALAAACASTSTPSYSQPRITGIAGVAPHYQPAFLALKDAVDEREDVTARRILTQLRARIDADRARETQAIRDAAEGEQPPRTTEDAERLAEGFEKVLDGRAFVDTLQLELITRRVKDSDTTMRIVLRGTTTHPAPLTLRPGPATLRVQRVTIGPNGQEGRSVRKTAVRNVEKLALDPNGSFELPLGTFPMLSGPGALAARTSWSLQLRSGVVLAEGESYPAMHVRVKSAEHVQLAPFLPRTPVAPEELVAYVQRESPTLPPIIERTVRIPAEEQDEALRLLAPVAAAFTDDQMRRLVPSLRWLGHTAAPGGDPLAWKMWLQSWAELDAGEGAAASRDLLPGQPAGTTTGANE